MRSVEQVTAFDRMCKKLCIDPSNTAEQMRSTELRAWVCKHKNTAYVPLALLNRLNTQTVYDAAEQAPFSIVEEVVIPDQIAPSEELPTDEPLAA